MLMASRLDAGRLLQARELWACELQARDSEV